MAGLHRDVARGHGGGGVALACDVSHYQSAIVVALGYKCIGRGGYNGISFQKGLVQDQSQRVALRILCVASVDSERFLKWVEEARKGVSNVLHSGLDRQGKEDRLAKENTIQARTRRAKKRKTI